MWMVLVGLATLAVATGWLPDGDAIDIGVTRAAPILGFLVAVTILAELSEAAGVFDAAAAVCARWARGRVAVLFVLVAVLATLVTIGMSLDTTAVLLTPVVLATTRRLGLPPLPFAVLVVWLANTASLLLPVSNLTNLLAMQHARLSAIRFAAHMSVPALVAIVLTVGYLAVVFRRQLTGRYPIPEPETPADPVAFGVCALACVGFAVAVAGGIVPWLAATTAAVVAVTVSALRGRTRLRWSLLPWRLVLTTEALFLVVAAITRHGLGHLLALAADHAGPATAVTAAVSSNLVNNLPAYLAMETTIPSGSGSARLFDVLVGTNTGPLITMWASLATLLWAERCRAAGVHIRPLAFAALGLGGVPLILLGTLAALHR
ncbi:arsenic transporter [Nocardia panacis]|uniref:Arsenic transporter n=1 Tax=Nocardia panacis TaxID=2340916 RepID=A0A3A4KVA0_9NOCA|nr:SLC13 family permease [Nocardia panacis]RJO73784.1 arsenic transporter [Nocardia panacis]